MTDKWQSLFADTCNPAPGASDEVLSVAIPSLFTSYSLAEKQEMYDRLLRYDPDKVLSLSIAIHKWSLKAAPLPDSYLSFIRWSNGGEFANGERYFRLIPIQGIRRKLIEHIFPEYLPQAIPFASDGGSGVYCFDMRQDGVDGEYPIIYARLSCLSYEWTVHLNNGFGEFCADPRYPD